LTDKANITKGQIYWAAKFAPERWSRSLSYWTGVFASAAWFFWTAGTFLLVAQLLLALVMALEPSYVQELWHTVLVSILSALFCLVLNVPAFRALPLLAKVMVIVTNCGTVLAAVALLVRAQPKRSAYEVFVEVKNVSGWSSPGVAFFLSLLPGVTAINGFDSAAHLAEEMDNPARQVPQVMIGNTLLSTIVGLPMAIVFCFCISKPDALLAPVGGQVVIQLFLDSLNSKGLFILIGLMWVWVTIVAAVGVTVKRLIIPALSLEVKSASIYKRSRDPGGWE
jgi:choline transport protein